MVPGHHAPACDTGGDLVPAKDHRTMNGIAVRADEELPYTGHMISICQDFTVIRDEPRFRPL
jgi:hypothetical protein